MDTLTHSLIGVGLAGLALGNPEVSQSPQAQQAIFLATFIGSQGPDLDIIYRIKGKVSYYQNHRGISHSIPTLITMSLATSLLLNMTVPEVSLSLLTFWVFIASFVHVGMDLLTPYNLNLFQPLARKTFSWNILFIIDPFIIAVLTTGILFWSITTLKPVDIFSWAFSIIGAYIFLRILLYLAIVRHLKVTLKQFRQQQGRYTIMPQFLPIKWDLILEDEEKIKTAYISIFPFEVVIEKTYWKQRNPSNSLLMEKTSQVPEIQAFLKEAKHLYVETTTIGNGYLVEWVDVGHKFRGRHPYTALVILNSNFDKVYADFGWRQKKIPSWTTLEGI